MTKSYRVILPLLLAVTAIHVPNALAQVAGLALNPARVEINLDPGQEKTVSFEIEAPASEKLVRGQLILSLADWNVSNIGALSYGDPGTSALSASTWAVFSPAAVTIVSGQTQRVRVTLRVPRETKPGVYRSAILVQERAPATPPKVGEHSVYLRFRYVYTIYAVVGQVTSHGELADMRFTQGGAVPALTFEMINTGSRHLRPLISWSLRSADGKSVASATRLETMVLLPGQTLLQAIPLGLIPPGDYEAYAEVNFQDNGEIQVIRRTIHIAAQPVITSN